MKKLFSVLAILGFSLMNAQVNWMTIEQAMDAQKKEPRKILIDFYADWCGPCKLMEKQTYSHPLISQYINENYYAVKFNAEGNDTVNFMGRVFKNPEFKKNAKGRNSSHEFAQYMNISAYPSTVFLDEDKNLITNLMGFFTPKNIEPYLYLFAKDDYKKVKTKEQWEDYQSKLKSNIKE